ncbi:MAG: HAD family hydrolase [Actinomycetota bacterium]
MMMPATRFTPETISAVVFDIGGVFTYPQYRPVHQALAAMGLRRPADVLAYRRAHHRGVRALADAMFDPEQPTTDEADRSVWVHYDQAYAEHLGVDEQYRADLAVAMRNTWDWVHVDNVAAFHRLNASGMPTAIVSNNDGTAVQQMTDYGICQIGPGPLPSVATIVDSTELGVAKPDPAIFAPALDALGLDPATVLYVGDTVHADVLGATQAGMQVVQLDPFDDHTDFEHARVATVDDVVAALT